MRVGVQEVRVQAARAGGGWWRARACVRGVVCVCADAAEGR